MLLEMREMRYTWMRGVKWCNKANKKQTWTSQRHGGDAGYVDVLPTPEVPPVERVRWLMGRG